MKKKSIVYYAFVLAMIEFIGMIGYVAGYSIGFKKRDGEIKQLTSSFSGKTLWGLLNEYRTKMSLSEFKIDARLCKYADRRAKEVEADWSHNAYVDNRGFFYENVCRECSGAGENLAKDYLYENEIVGGWLKSDAHRKLIEGDFNIGCIGVYLGPEGKVFVAMEVGKTAN